MKDSQACLDFNEKIWLLKVANDVTYQFFCLEQEEDGMAIIGAAVHDLRPDVIQIMDYHQAEAQGLTEEDDETALVLPSMKTIDKSSFDEYLVADGFLNFNQASFNNNAFIVTKG